MLKKISYGLLGLIAIIAIAIAIYLIPPHQQIREFQSEIPSFAQVSALLNASTGPQQISYITTASQKSPMATMGHVGILLQWANGKSFLIDSGMNRADAQAFGKPMESIFDAEPTQTFGPLEEQMGPAIKQISGIAFSHLHTDHTSGITAICQAIGNKATIYQTSDQSQHHNVYTEAGQQLINQSNCKKSVLDDQIIKPVPGFDGLFAIAAAGHTPGSTVYATKVDDQLWFFAGDITNAMSNLRQNQGKGFIYSYLIVPEDTQRLEKLRVWLADIDSKANAKVLVAHDLDEIQLSGLTAWQADAAMAKTQTP